MSKISLDNIVELYINTNYSISLIDIKRDVETLCKDFMFPDHELLFKELDFKIYKKRLELIRQNINNHHENILGLESFETIDLFHFNGWAFKDLSNKAKSIEVYLNSSDYSNLRSFGTIHDNAFYAIDPLRIYHPYALSNLNAFQEFVEMHYENVVYDYSSDNNSGEENELLSFDEEEANYRYNLPKKLILLEELGIIEFIKEQDKNLSTSDLSKILSKLLDGKAQTIANTLSHLNNGEKNDPYLNEDNVEKIKTFLTERIKFSPSK